MKIVYCANSRFPSERAHTAQIAHMCNAFAALGHEVVLLATDRETSVTDSAEVYYKMKFTFTVEKLSIPDFVKFEKKVPKFLHPFLFTMQRFVYAWRAAKRAKELKADVVYGRDEWIIFLLSKLQNKQVVWESHEAHYSWPARQLIKSQSLVVVISEGIRDFYVRQGESSSKFLVAHDAIDGSFFAELKTQAEARSLLGINIDKPVVMYIGSLGEWKGVSTLAQAAEGLTEAKVVVLGGNKEQVRSYKDKYPEVEFLGGSQYSDLPVHQQAADILVIPNSAKTKVSAEYTSPLKLFTYMTAKRPIIASDIPSLRNILNEKNAYFFTADDADSLRSVIRSVLSEPDIAKKKAEAAFVLSKRYTWVNRARDIMSALEK